MPIIDGRARTGVLCAVVMVTAASGGGKKQYRQTVPMGTKGISEGQSCAVLSASATAGSFFQGLERRRGPKGIEFYKGSARVTEFPAQVRVKVQAVGVPCSPTPVAGLPHGASHGDFLRKLRFQADWRRNSGSRVSVEGLSPHLDQPASARLADTWFYEMDVPSLSIPLTGKLILRVQAQDGSELAKFSLFLANP